MENLWYFFFFESTDPVWLEIEDATFAKGDHFFLSVALFSQIYIVSLT